MSRIAQTFARLGKQKERALIAYVMAGDPEAAYTVDIVQALTEGGSDMIELGVPFSDPIADGPTIQAASVRAMQSGTTPKTVFRIVEGIREKSEIPIALMTYYNPIFRMGLNSFMESTRANGADGLIVPDLPVEEADDYRKTAVANEIDTIFLMAPSTPPSRVNKILRFTSGFLYLVSVFGVTGTRSAVQNTTLKFIARTRSISKNQVPLAVGFGISKPEHVTKILKAGADAAIVGSGFVKIIETMSGHEEETLESLKNYARQLKNATKSIE